ncbi:hypothetical protein MX009_06415 [Streptococcus uberis]|uniref:hypothetical protein n=1 Tax=Streptococcus uberis TaxID=1349 RepID=UPI001FF186BF|nr:hypothetical protein [Streptococcus uberis]MCK1230013.1 hypothetical protein [Streptococcus uberis]
MRSVPFELGLVLELLVVLLEALGVDLGVGGVIVVGGVSETLLVVLLAVTILQFINNEVNTTVVAR